MNQETTLVVPSAVMARQVGDETVILDLSRGMYFSLDPVGARIWQLISEGQPLGSIVASLLSQYEVAEDQLRQDVSTLIEELLSRGLVEASR